MQSTLTQLLLVAGLTFTGSTALADASSSAFDRIVNGDSDNVLLRRGGRRGLGVGRRGPGRGHIGRRGPGRRHIGRRGPGRRHIGRRHPGGGHRWGRRPHRPRRHWRRGWRRPIRRGLVVCVAENGRGREFYGRARRYHRACEKALYRCEINSFRPRSCEVLY